MQFIEVAAEDLMKLREGLGILESLNHEIVSSLDIWIYGITTSPGILDAARKPLLLILVMSSVKKTYSSPK